MYTYVVAFLVALVVAWFLTPFVKSFAVKIGAIDKPDPRKIHHELMPRLGGLAIYVGFVAGVLACVELDRELIGMLVGGTFILIVGMLDDKYQLSARVKLLGQIMAALILIAFGNKIEWINNPSGGYIYLEYLSIPFTVFWVVSFTNVVNLMDGLDGLAAGVSAIASLTMICVSLHMGITTVAVITAALAGGILGFIRYNFNPATIFMGDTGSLFIGYVLSAISIYGAVKSAATVALLVPAIALGLPIMDTAFAILRRYTNHKPIFKPDKGHFHHRLLAMGLSQRQAVMLMYLISAGLGISVILITEMEGVYAIMLLVAIVIGVVVAAERMGILRDDC